MNRAAIVADLKREEDFRASAYADHLGFLTIGYGTCIDERKGCGISEGEAELMLLNRLDKRAQELADRLPFWKQLSDARQNALCLMAYQLGTNGTLNFKKMIDALAKGQWLTAKKEALDSRWADQTPARAARVAHMLAEG